MYRLSLRHIGIFSTAKFGCMLGALLNVIPAFAIALVIKFAISALRVMLEGWQNLEIVSILGQSVRVNLIERLGWVGALKFLRDFDNASWLLVMAIALGLTLCGGALVAIFASAGAAIYNLIAKISGGIAVELANEPAGNRNS
jgi:hypothetical protein